MDPRPRVGHALIVEGKYDKIKLESLVDALILPTDGFRIFRNKEMRALIRRLAGSCGVAVLTDSDAAGFLIRRHLRGIVGDAPIVDVYIPDLPGKEPRKRHPSREGKLGVEGVPADVVLEALRQAGLLEETPAPRTNSITRSDLYEAGLSGGENSRALRAALLHALELPARLSATALPGVLSRMMDREELLELAEQLRVQLEDGKA